MNKHIKDQNSQSNSLVRLISHINQNVLQTSFQENNFSLEKKIDYNTDVCGRLHE